MMRIQKLKIFLLNLYDFAFFRVMAHNLNKSKSDSNNLLLLCSSGLGDLLIAKNLITYSSEIHKNLYFIIRSEFEHIAKSIYPASNFIPFDKKKYRFNIIYKIKFTKRIRDYKAETFITLNRGRSYLDDQIALFSGSKEIWALGPTPKGFIKLFKRNMDQYYDKLLFPGIESEYIKLCKLGERLGISDSQEQTAPQSFNNGLRVKRKKIIIAPFASLRIKEWAFQNYHAIISWLSESIDCEIFLIGITSQKKSLPELNQVYNKINSQSLEEDVALIKSCDLFIGNDSGLAHLAKYYQRPRIIISGGGCYGAYFPYGSQVAEEILFCPQDCFLCEWNCKHKEPLCITEVSVEQVKKEIKKYL